MSITAGFQVPVIPFVDVAGRVGAVASLQMLSAVPKSKPGTAFGTTVTSNVTGVAQIPAVGVKV